jgi:hypothetical protein
MASAAGMLQAAVSRLDETTETEKEPSETPAAPPAVRPPGDVQRFLRAKTKEIE